MSLTWQVMALHIKSQPLTWSWTWLFKWSNKSLNWYMINIKRQIQRSMELQRDPWLEQASSSWRSNTSGLTLSEVNRLWLSDDCSYLNWRLWTAGRRGWREPVKLDCATSTDCFITLPFCSSPTEFHAVICTSRTFFVFMPSSQWPEVLKARDQMIILLFRFKRK